MKKPFGFILLSYFLFWLVGVLILGIASSEDESGLPAALSDHQQEVSIGN